MVKKVDVKRIQVTASPVTYARLLKQADELGMTVAAYCSQMVARGAKAEELSTIHLPELYKKLGNAIGAESVQIAIGGDNLDE